MIKFIGKIKLGPNDIGSNEVEITYEKSETELLYDEVEDGLLIEMDKRFSHDNFPKAEIYEIFISSLAIAIRCPDSWRMRIRNIRMYSLIKPRKYTIRITPKNKGFILICLLTLNTP